MNGKKSLKGKGITKNKKENKSFEYGGVSIRLLVFVMGVIFITLTSLLVGYANYKIHEFEAERILNEKLETITSDWVLLTNSYIKQYERVLSRELRLTEKRLDAVLIGIKEEIFDIQEKNVTKEEISFFFSEWFSEYNLGKKGFIFTTGDFELEYDAINLLTTKQQNVLFFIKEKNLTTYSFDNNNIFHYSLTLDEINISDTVLVSSWFIEEANTTLFAVMFYSDFVSYELKDQLVDELKVQMARQSIGDLGYIYILDEDGNYVVSKELLRNGENIYNIENSDGVYPVREIIDIAKNNPGVSFYKYKWRNYAENKDYSKTTTITYLKEWGWILGVSAYEDDYLSGLHTIRNSIIILCFLSVIIVLVPLNIFISKFVVTPVKDMEHSVVKVAKGDLRIRVSNSFGGIVHEFSILGTAFNEMMRQFQATYKKAKDLSESLEKKVEKRTSQLQDANFQVKRALHNKTIFLNQVAHDLRTPLTPIKLLLEKIIKNEKLSQTSKNDLGIVKRNVDSLLYLVTDVLNLVRLEANSNKVNKDEVQSKDLIKKVIENFEEVFKKEHITVKLSFQRNIPVVFCDTNKISEVISNLISNSLKYMKNDKKEIHIRVSFSKEYVFFKMKDTGVGVDKNNVDKIFEEFFKEDQYYGGESTGLGLSICKRIIKSHDGKIWAESKGRNQGLTVFFTLPLESKKNVNIGDK